MKKAPCVDVRTDVHKDVRFEVLGELGGYNRYEALGRMHALWSWCIDRGLQDAPDDSDGYVVSEAVVRRFLGANGATAIMGDGCDEFALGELRGGGRIYLRGTSEYVADRRSRVAVASAGGSARANGPRDGDGRYVGHNTNVQPYHQQDTSRQPAGEPAAHQPSPASSSSSSPSTSDLQDVNARVRERPPGAGRVARNVWDYGLRIRGELAAAGLTVPAWPVMVGSDHSGWTGLLDRICEQLVDGTPDSVEQLCRNRIDVAAAKVRAGDDGNWFASSSMFKRNSFETWAALDPKQFSRKSPKRRGSDAIGAAPPRSDHPDGTTLIPINEL